MKDLVTEALDMGGRGTLKGQLFDALSDHRAQVGYTVDTAQRALNARVDRLLQDMEVDRRRLAELERVHDRHEASLLRVDAKAREGRDAAFKTMEEQGIHYEQLAARVQTAMDESKSTTADYNREINERL